MKLKDRVCLVTGASRGIGRGIALALGAEGAAICVHYHDRAEAAETVVRELQAMGRDAMAVAADLASTEDCQRLIHEVSTHWNRLDVLVNNAGVLDPIPSGTLGIEAFDHTIAVDLKATWLLSRLTAPILARQRGCIVNISSLAGIVAFPYASHYAAAKAGVTALTSSLALELAPGVRVNAVAPGYTNTGDPLGWSEQRMPDLVHRIPMRRFGRPEDVAKAVLFLAADAPYVTGTTILVDGGATLAIPGLATRG